MAMEDQVEKIGIELFYYVVGAVECQGGAPIFEYAARGAIDGRVVNGRDALLKQLAGDLRNIESTSAGIGAGYDRSSGRVTDAREDRAFASPEITRVVMQDAG